MSKRSNLPVMERVLRLRERMAIKDDVAKKTTLNIEASKSVDNQCTQSLINASFLVKDQLDEALQVESLNQPHLDSWRDWIQWDQWTQWSSY